MTTSSAAIASATLQTAGSTDAGLQRSDNQDAYGGWSDSEGRYLLVVADGLGGHRGGATASRLAIEVFEDVFAESEGLDGESLLLEAFEAANTRIFETAREDRELAGMGTTGVALFVDLNPEHPNAWIGHVGDSRAYRLRHGVFERLTLDHTLRAQLRATQGLVTEELNGVPGADALMRALGPESEVDVEVHPVSIEPGDRFLLCSDGLWGPVPDAQTADILARHTPDDAAQVLIAEANRRGGPDNVTLLILAIPGAAEAALGAPDADALADEPPSETGSPNGLPSAPLPAIEELPSRGPAIGGMPVTQRPRWIVPVAATAAVITAVLIAGLLVRDRMQDERPAAGRAVEDRVDLPAQALPPSPAEPLDEAQADPPAPAQVSGAPTKPEGPLLRAPAPIAETRRMKRAIEEAQKTFGAFASALERCDRKALEPLTAPALRPELELRCTGVEANGQLQPAPESWRWLRPGVVRVDLNERREGRETALRAVLEEIAEGKRTSPGTEPDWRVVSIEPRDRSASP